MSQRDGEHLAAGAHADRVEALGLADRPRRLDPVDDRLDVGVEVEAVVLGPGVDPGQVEDLVAAVQQVLDEAAAGREVRQVVLVDERRDDQQRLGVDPRRARPVLDQLHGRRAMDDRPGRRGQVLAELEVGRLGAGGQARRAAHVVHEPARARDEAPPAGVDDRLERGRVREREVGRRQRRDEVAREQAQAVVAAVRRAQLRPGGRRRRPRRPCGPGRASGTTDCRSRPCRRSGGRASTARATTCRAGSGLTRTPGRRAVRRPSAACVRAQRARLRLSRSAIGRRAQPNAVDSSAASNARPG